MKFVRFLLLPNPRLPDAAAISFLVGLPVNHATGVVGVQQESREDLDRLLALSAKILPRIILRTLEMLPSEDLAFGHGSVYRVEGGVGRR